MMGRLIVLTVLLTMMVGLDALKTEVSGVQDPLTLAAIGLVLLASYTAAEIGGLLRLPRVTGYIAAGVLLGPSVGNILSASVVLDMTMFNTLALGLIATGAGLELDFRGLAAVKRTLAVTIAVKMVLACGLVFATFYALQTLFAPLDVLAGDETIAVGLVLAVLAIGTSPAIVLAVVTELQSKTRMASLALSAAVLKDIVVVVALAIALAVAGAMLDAGAAGSDDVIHRIALELGGSIVLGAAVGLVIILYVRLIRAEMLLFIAALVLAVAEVCTALHLDLLLVFIASGFTVRNFSKHWEDVLHALETVSLPVFVVFFTIAGARIDLAATATLLPFALALAAARALGYFGAARIGGWAGREEPMVRRWAFAAYLPQAGVTLGLLGLAAAALPAVGDELAALGLAVVAVNLAIGPITLRRALQVPPVSAAEGAEVVESASAEPVAAPATVPLAQTLRELDAGTEELSTTVRQFVADLAEGAQTNAEHICALLDLAVRAPLATLQEESEQATTSERRRALVEALRRAELMDSALDRARGLFEAFERAVQELPIELQAPLPRDELRGRAGDSVRLRVRRMTRRLRAVFVRSARVRRVPVRALARIALAHRVAALAQGEVQATVRGMARLLAHGRSIVASEQGNAEAVAALDAELAAVRAALAADVEVTFARGAAELGARMRAVDTPRSPVHEVRYAPLEPATRSRLRVVVERPFIWEDVVGAVVGDFELAHFITRAQQGFAAAVDDKVLQPLTIAAEAFETVSARCQSLLSVVLDASADGSRDAAGLQSMQWELAAITELRDDTIKADGGVFRSGSVLHAVTTDLRLVVDALAEEVVALSPHTPLESISNPEEVDLRTVALRQEASRQLVFELVPVLDHEIRLGAGVLQELDGRIVEALDVVASAIENLPAADRVDAGLERETISRSRELLREASEEAQRDLIEIHDKLEAAVTELVSHLQSMGRPTVSAARARAAAQRVVAERLRMLARRGRTAAAVAAHALVDRVKRVLRVIDLRGRLARSRSQPPDLAATLSALADVDVPASYARLFRLEPLRTPRMVAAREEEVERVLRAETSWRSGSPSSVLVVGARGSGRTTLLSLCESRLERKRVLRPEALRSRRGMGLPRALAYELGCRPSGRELTDALRGERWVIIIDDLEHWLPVGAGNVGELRTILNLVAATRESTFWLVATSQQFEATLAELLPVDSVFASRVDLAPLGEGELRAVIMARHALSGFQLTHSRATVIQMLGRVRRQSAEDVSFRLLHVASEGNLSAALALWPRGLVFEGERVRVSLRRLMRLRRLPIDALDAIAQAILVELFRFGPMSVRGLSETLITPHDDTQRQLVGLLHLGLVREVQGGAHAITPGLEALVGAAFRERGALERFDQGRLS